MKANDFLQNKKITKATCYTDNGTYYIDGLSELLEEYAELKSIEFKEWADKLTPTQRCTVHPPAGSGGGYGLYELPTAELYQQFKNKL